MMLNTKVVFVLNATLVVVVYFFIMTLITLRAGQSSKCVNHCYPYIVATILTGIVGGSEAEDTVYQGLVDVTTIKNIASCRLTNPAIRLEVRSEVGRRLKLYCVRIAIPDEVITEGIIFLCLERRDTLAGSWAMKHSTFGWNWGILNKQVAGINYSGRGLFYCDAGRGSVLLESSQQDNGLLFNYINRSWLIITGIVALFFWDSRSFESIVVLEYLKIVRDLFVNPIQFKLDTYEGVGDADGRKGELQTSRRSEKLALFRSVETLHLKQPLFSVKCSITNMGGLVERTSSVKFVTNRVLKGFSCLFRF
jgi:hypothetical protein